MIQPTICKIPVKAPVSIKNTFVKVAHKYALYSQKIYHKSEYKHIGAFYRRLKNGINGTASQKRTVGSPLFTQFLQIFTQLLFKNYIKASF